MSTEIQATDLTSLNPDFTPEVMSQVDEIIERNVGKPGCLIPVLTGCQEVVGYLPVEQHIEARLFETGHR